MTGDRSYGRPSLLAEIQNIGMSFLIVMPQNLTKFHSSVARSTLNHEREDNIENDTDCEDGNNTAAGRGSNARVAP